MLIKLVFETLLSPDELELNKFIGSNGGPDKFMENDRLLKDLMEKRKDQLKRSPSFSPQGQIASQLEGDRFKELKEELKTNLDSSLDESRKLFDQKFKEQSHQFEEVKNVVTRESDRIIKQIRSGAHNRVIDKVCVPPDLAYRNCSDKALGYAPYMDGYGLFYDFMADRTLPE